MGNNGLKSKDNLKFKISCGVMLTIVGIIFLLSDFINNEREQAFSRVNVELNELLAVNNEQAPVESTPPVEEQVPVEEQQPAPTPTPAPVNDDQYETFAGVLEIPKISFSKGFYKKGSSLNNVKFNLKILDVSSYPDEDKGNVIIIGHSGNYSNSYFGNLYKLDVGDIASIQYQGKKYNYKIVNIYTDQKDGTVTLYRDETKNCLTLITCTKDDDTTQTIYIFERISIE